MKILVTGSEGFIGRHVVKALEKPDAGSGLRLGSRGHQVSGFDRSRGDDVRDFERVRAALRGKDAVVHLAALCHGTESLEKPADYFHVNELGTFNVFEAARLEGCRVVFAASAASLDPQRPYGLTKLHSEQWGRVYRELFRVPVYNLRFFNVYGPGDDKSVVNIFVQRALAGKPLQVYGDGEQSRDFIAVEDLARLIRGFALGERPAGDYDLATGRTITINALAGLVQKLANPGVAIEHLPALAGDIRFSKAAAPVGGTELSLEQGVRRLVAHYKTGGA